MTLAYRAGPPTRAYLHFPFHCASNPKSWLSVGVFGRSQLDGHFSRLDGRLDRRAERWRIAIELDSAGIAFPGHPSYTTWPGRGPSSTPIAIPASGSAPRRSIRTACTRAAT